MSEPSLSTTPLLTAAWLVDQQQQLASELARRVAAHLVGVTTEQVLGLLEEESARELPTELLGAYVSLARYRGAAWQEIATRLGVTRQAAHKRFRDHVDRYTPLLPGHGTMDRAEAARRLRSSTLRPLD